MNRRRGLTDLVLATASVCLSRAMASSRDLGDGVIRGRNEPVRQKSGGRKLRRRQRRRDEIDGERRLQSGDNFLLEIAFDDVVTALDDVDDSSDPSAAASFDPYAASSEKGGLLDIMLDDVVIAREDIDDASDPSPVPWFYPSAASSDWSPCRSIVAVGGWRRRDLAFSNDFGSAFGPVDEVISFHSAEEQHTHERFVCERHDGSTVPIEGTEEQFAEMRRLLNSGDLISAESTVEIEAEEFVGQHSFGAADGFASQSKRVKLPPGSVKMINSINSNNGNETQSRRLKNSNKHNKFEGIKKVLVVRVTDRNGRTVDGDAAYISDKFFGTHGNELTMASGFDACSFGKLTMTNNYQSKYVDEDLLSAPGVLDVDVDLSLDESAMEIVMEDAQRALQRKLGLKYLPGPFHHVAFLLEGCYDDVGTECEFSAWAQVNHWLSLFFGDNYKYPAVVMHELGHNLNLAHSGGADGVDYTDHTCLMGNPWFEEDVGRMCFNPAKNYQIAVGGKSWYDNYYTAYFDSGTKGGTFWVGALVGVADYANNPSNHPIVLKLESGEGDDWFVGFNRATGVNSDTAQASDEVTITKVAAGHGWGYSASSLQGSLREGGRKLTVEDWRGTGMDLVIGVNKIGTDFSPGYAEVEVAFGPQTPHPTNTGSPTPDPTRMPTTARLTARPIIKPTRRPTNSFMTKAQSNDAESGGLMFTVAATAGEVRITSFDVMGKKDGEGTCMVYTRTGDYLGREEDYRGWDLVFDQNVKTKWNAPSDMGDLDREVIVPVGSTQSFYIWCKKGMLYTRSEAKRRDVPFDSDGSLVINEGVATKKWFQKVIGHGQYSGGIRYYTLTTEQLDATPIGRPTPRPTGMPMPRPTRRPTPRPSMRPSNRPTPRPTPRPTRRPTNEPTPRLTAKPTTRPTNRPTPRPTRLPSKVPTAKPTSSPSNEPTNEFIPMLITRQPPTFAPTANDIVHFDSGTAAGTGWSGRIVGAAHLGSNPSNHPIVVMLESGEASSWWFVGFNDVHVTLTRISNGRSSLLGALDAGQRETVSNWRNSGLDLEVTVREINTDASPGYADVQILFGPTLLPSKKPTDKPTSLSTSMATLKDMMRLPALHHTVGGIVSFDSGTAGGTFWSGQIIGVSHYGNNDSNLPIIIMLTSEDASDWLVGFNDIHVTITKVEDGQGSLKGALVAGQSETISNWRHSGLDLVIDVHEINIDVSPGYADVEIRFGPQQH